MRSLLLLFACCLPHTVPAQNNLLNNGDFETFSYETKRVINTRSTNGLPQFSSSFLNRNREYYHVPEWYVPLGTPDLIDDRSICNGAACIGMFTCYDQDNYQEYLIGTLSEPMIRDSTYSISFVIRPGNRAGTIEHQLDPRYIGFLFTPSPGVYDNLPLLLKNSTPEKVKLPIFLDSTWTTITLEYKAKGGETHVMIGAFSDPDANRRRVNMREVDPIGYIHLDDIRITRKYNAPRGPHFLTIHYAEDIHTLSTTQQQGIQSFMSSIDSLDHPYSIDIVAYASKKGDSEYNQALSERRAKVIRDFLFELGVPASRISIEGKGEHTECTRNCRKTDVVVKFDE